jgi:hypothetical protein
MWLTILKVAALAIVVVGTLSFAVVYGLRRRRNRSSMDSGPWSHTAQVFGAYAPVPKPEWADWVDDESGDGPPRTP